MRISKKANNPLDTGYKSNVHKTFRRRLERLLNLLCILNLRPVSKGKHLRAQSKCVNRKFVYLFFYLLYFLAAQAIDFSFFNATLCTKTPPLSLSLCLHFYHILPNLGHYRNNLFFLD